MSITSIYSKSANLFFARNTSTDGTPGMSTDGGVLGLMAFLASIAAARSACRFSSFAVCSSWKSLKDRFGGEGSRLLHGLLVLATVVQSSLEDSASSGKTSSGAASGSAQ